MAGNTQPVFSKAGASTVSRIKSLAITLPSALRCISPTARPTAASCGEDGMRIRSGRPSMMMLAMRYQVEVFSSMPSTSAALAAWRAR